VRGTPGHKSSIAQKATAQKIAARWKQQLEDQAKADRNIPVITTKTKLVNSAAMRSHLEIEKGVKLSSNTVSRYCKQGRWKEGIHWIKRCNEYLFNLDAIDDWVVYGELPD
jgi:hypothetical protein